MTKELVLQALTLKTERDLEAGFQKFWLEMEGQVQAQPEQLANLLLYRTWFHDTYACGWYDSALAEIEEGSPSTEVPEEPLAVPGEGPP